VRLGTYGIRTRSITLRARLSTRQVRYTSKFFTRTAMPRRSSRRLQPLELSGAAARLSVAASRRRSLAGVALLCAALFTFTVALYGPKAALRDPAQHSTANLQGAYNPETESLSYDSFVFSLRDALHTRIRVLAEEHIRLNRSHAVGFRGVSFLHARYGALLSMPRILYAARYNRTIRLEDANNTLVLEVENLNKSSDCAEMHRASLWVRVEGQQIAAKVVHALPGRCIWRAAFQLAFSGEYTVFARTVFFNGQIPQPQQLCEAWNASAEAVDSLVLLHDVVANPDHVAADPERRCCFMCARIEACEFSLRPVPAFSSVAADSPRPHDAVFNALSAQGETRCLIFRRALAANEPGAVAAHDVHRVFNVTGGTLVRSRPVPARDLQRMLGCGRDAFWTAWAPCASAGHVPANALMPGTEDVVVFEAEARVRVELFGETARTAKALLLGSDKPVCALNRDISLRRGSYIRVPAHMLDTSCVHESANADHHGTHLAQFNARDPVLCNARWNLHRIIDHQVNWGPFDASAGAEAGTPSERRLHVHTYRSELSDSYAHNQTQFAEPVKAGPVAVVYALDADVPCRLSRWRSAMEVRQCFIARDVGHMVFFGASIARGLSHALAAILGKAFPEPGEFIRGAYNQLIAFGFNASRRTWRSTGKFVWITNLFAPHIVLQRDHANANLTWLVESHARHLLKLVALRADVHRKIWFTPALQVYERQAGQVYGHYEAMAREVRARWLTAERGWVQIDYAPLTTPFVYDSTPSGDSLHYVGPSLFELAQLVISVICD